MFFEKPHSLVINFFLFFFPNNVHFFFFFLSAVTPQRMAIKEGLLLVSFQRLNLFDSLTLIRKKQKRKKRLLLLLLQL